MVYPPQRRQVNVRIKHKHAAVMGELARYKGITVGQVVEELLEKFIDSEMASVERFVAAVMAGQPAGPDARAILKGEDMWLFAVQLYGGEYVARMWPTVEQWVAGAGRLQDSRT